MKELFKKHNLKLTNQRQYIFSLVNSLGTNATLKNIGNASKNIMNNSTVYRIVELLVEKGIFEKEINYNNEIYYSLKEEHGHYITCIKCHKKEKIDICPLENIENQLENNEGYKIVNHTVSLDGICRECQKKK